MWYRNFHLSKKYLIYQYDYVFDYGADKNVAVLNSFHALLRKIY